MPKKIPSDKLTDWPLADQALADRMAATVAGQVSWVDLGRTETCAECQHYSEKGSSSDGFGYCGEATSRNGNKMVKKIPRTARACSLFGTE